MYAFYGFVWWAFWSAKWRTVNCLDRCCWPANLKIFNPIHNMWRRSKEIISRERTTIRLLRDNPWHMALLGNGSRGLNLTYQSSTEEFPDWVAVVEEILKSKEKTLDKRFYLISNKLRGSVVKWSQQLKRECGSTRQTESETVEPQAGAFVPCNYNYSRALYWQLQYLHQGSRSIDIIPRSSFKLWHAMVLMRPRISWCPRYIVRMRQQFQFQLKVRKFNNFSK